MFLYVAKNNGAMSAAVWCYMRVFIAQDPSVKISTFHILYSMNVTITVCHKSSGGHRRSKARNNFPGSVKILVVCQ